jgi:dTDP-4-dehydrorhamnose 3,5-epimerase
MRIRPAKLSGVFRVEIEPLRDERGFFARSFCAEEFAASGLNSSIVQCSFSFNPRRGTLRGLHFQNPPYAEAKLIRCAAGAIYDVVLDIRRDSATFGRWEAFELCGDGLLSLYVGEGFAHGFQTLVDNTQVLYAMSQFHRPESIAGINWADPRLAIPWPVPDPIISAKDRTLPALAEMP